MTVKIRFRYLITACVLGLLLVGCGSSGGSSRGSSSENPNKTPTAATGAEVPTKPEATAPATATATAPAVATATSAATSAAIAASTATATLAPGFFRNPVLDQDFPDPDVLKVGDTYYAYATNSGTTNIQVARSKDLVHWEVLAGALPKLPSWAGQQFGYTWAPEVTTPASGKGYLMYFVDRFPRGQGGIQCIGAATSDKPEGPFQPTSDKPFICQMDQGGSIDPSSFVDEDGKRYILWKNDGNSNGGRTWLYIQPVSDDGLTLQGASTQLVTADKPWEGVLVEAPTLWKHAGKYYLFYSANAYNSPSYAIGYATADKILGPYTKPGEPLLTTSIPARIVGPGGQDIVVGPKGGDWILFHGWAGAAEYRRLYLAPLTWENDAPVVKIDDGQPIPAP